MQQYRPNLMDEQTTATFYPNHGLRNPRMAPEKSFTLSKQQFEVASSLITLPEDASDASNPPGAAQAWLQLQTTAARAYTQLTTDGHSGETSSPETATPHSTPATSRTSTAASSPPANNPEAKISPTYTRQSRPAFGKRVSSFVKSIRRTSPKKKEAEADVGLDEKALLDRHLYAPAKLHLTQGMKGTTTSQMSILDSHVKQERPPPILATASSEFADRTAQSHQEVEPQPLKSCSNPNFSGPSNDNMNEQSITWVQSEGTNDPSQSPSSCRRRPSISCNDASLLKPPVKDTSTAIFGLLSSLSKDADHGTGLKSRKISVSVPKTFNVDTCELHDEFTSSSKIPFKRGPLLGEGATAKVKRMLRKSGDGHTFYAVKEFRGKRKSESESGYTQKVMSEYTIALSLCGHPNIVDTFRLCTHGGKWNHVMEFCANGELFPLVKEGTLKEEDKLCLFKQLLNGVQYMHSRGIAHRDIKLENLLITSNGRLKITDFGLSEVFYGEHPGVTYSPDKKPKPISISDDAPIRLCEPGECGSLPYVSPEVLAQTQKYDPRALDVWSCGMVFLTMQFGGMIWEEATVDMDKKGSCTSDRNGAKDPRRKIYADFYNGWTNWLKRHPDGDMNNADPDDCTPKCGVLFEGMLPDRPSLRRLVLCMLCPDPAMRVSAKECVESRVVKAIECCVPGTPPSSSGVCLGLDGGGESEAAQVWKSHNHAASCRENRASKRFSGVKGAA